MNRKGIYGKNHSKQFLCSFGRKEEGKERKDLEESVINGACTLKPAKNRWNLLSVTVCVRSVRNNLWFEKNITIRNEERKIYDILLKGLAIEYYVRVLCVCFADFASIFILSSFLTLIINNSSSKREKQTRSTEQQN